MGSDVENSFVRNIVCNYGLFQSNSFIPTWKLKIRSNEVTFAIVFGRCFFLSKHKNDVIILDIQAGLYIGARAAVQVGKDDSVAVCVEVGKGVDVGKGVGVAVGVGVNVHVVKM